MNIESMTPTDLMIQDLAKSGLTPQDMYARVLDEASRAAAKVNPGVKGYVIPYFTLGGKMTQYYRVRIFNPTPGGQGLEYLQLPNTPSHVYFPKNFQEAMAGVRRKICLLTAGETKAALCCLKGIPCAAFSGVESWRNKTILLPRESEIFNQGSRFLGVKLPVGDYDESTMSPWSIGLQELLDLGLAHKTTFIIVFDRDGLHGLDTRPQRSAARLGFEMRTKGFHIAQIRQLIPPRKFARGQGQGSEEGKATLEDIILSDRGPEQLGRLITENLQKRVAFPLYPDIRDYASKMLGRPNMSRKDTQAISMAILTELDSKGRRMYSSDSSQMYYFDGRSHHLMKVSLNVSQPQVGQETEFGRLLYKDFGLALAGDAPLVKWLGAMFAGEEPLELVSPFRILGRPKGTEDAIRYQINDGQYIKVTGSDKAAFQILPNGAENTLFESRASPASEIPGEQVVAEINRQLKLPLKNQWLQVLDGTRISSERGRLKELTSYLYYVSPWLMRWRGLQLPIEIVIGEAGSGKSTLYELRLSIVTGEPRLRNAPNDLKDWNASIANTGALHVTDNVQLVDKQLRQRISDELCRLVTEPDPKIQTRKYYTEADEISIKANMAFAFTSIQPPFNNPDVLQRALYLELSKDPADSEATFESQWRDKQLKRFGGRAGWVAHHMIVLHEFFKLVKKEWSPSYRAKHRLVGLEQSLILVAKVLGDSKGGEWIPDFLQEVTNRVIFSAEWAMEGLCEFAELIRTKEAATQKHYPFGTNEISAWASSHEGFEKCRTLNNSRACAKYIAAHKYDIANIAGIVETGTQNNRMMYKVVPTALARTKRN
jgi:hypothetical protein